MIYGGGRFDGEKGNSCEPQIQPRLKMPWSGSSFCNIHDGMAGAAVVGHPYWSLSSRFLAILRVGVEMFLLRYLMISGPALSTVDSMTPGLMPLKLRNSKSGTARVMPEMFSSAVFMPAIRPSMSLSRVVSLSGDRPSEMLVIQSFTVRQSCLLVSVFFRHHTIPSVCEFGFGASTVPPQNCESSLHSPLTTE